MKKVKNNPKSQGDDMLPEYNFAGKKGVRGKYYDPNRKGYTVMVYNEDGTVNVRYVSLGKDTVTLAPDVREYFPDSETVNNALRSLIALIPTKKRNGRQVSKTR